MSMQWTIPDHQSERAAEHEHGIGDVGIGLIVDRQLVQRIDQRHVQDASLWQRDEKLDHRHPKHDLIATHKHSHTVHSLQRGNEEETEREREREWTLNGVIEEALFQRSAHWVIDATQ